MRLDNHTLSKIIEYKNCYFGDGSRLYLFGSRADDTKKGGDIDLFLDSPVDVHINTEIQFLKTISIKVTQRKVDLIVKAPNKKEKPIFKTARNEGILLC